MESSTALFTDRYEYSMLDAALRAGSDGVAGVADRWAVFEVFTRRLPPGRRYGVVAGTARVIDAIRRFQIGDPELAYLASLGLSSEVMERLRSWRFRGSVWGLVEGEVFFAGCPILTVEAPFAEAVLLETVVLSILNHDCAIAAAASRMKNAAGTTRLLEMGSRRTDPDAAVAAARAAAIAGFDATSNLFAGRTYGLITAGTAAHAFTLAHLDEHEAFRAQITAQGIDTTLLVDTWDIPEGLRTAVAVAREFGAKGPGGVRIDSGDLVEETRRARALLDELGATDTRIVISGDLDEYAIERLLAAGSSINTFGVGTALVTGSGAPTAGLTYKLVAIEGRDGRMHSVAKRSAGKAGVGGRKRASRVTWPDGSVTDELRLDPSMVAARRARWLAGEWDGAEPDLTPEDATALAHVHALPAAATKQRLLQTAFLLEGQALPAVGVVEAAAHHRRCVAELAHLGLTGLEPGEPTITPLVTNVDDHDQERPRP